MNVSSFKKSILILVSLYAIFALSGCQKKPPDESQIILDMPGELTEILVDDVPIGMGIDNIEITRRQTNEKDDTVYFKYEMSGGPYRVTGSFRFDYVYYDQGGWILDDYALNSEPEICITDDEAIVSMFSEFAHNDLADSYDTVEYIGYEKIDDQSYAFNYNIYQDNRYRDISGTRKQVYTIEHNWGLNFIWYEDFKKSDWNVSEIWDIVGTWEWRYADENDNLIVVIDSYNPTDQSIHISTAKLVDHLYLSQVETKTWNDITIYLEDDSSTDGLRLIFHPNSDPEFLASGGWYYMNRISK